jgi:2-phospho-L-lactate/phosphoenolpyruvate guanylyltransferase
MRAILLPVKNFREAKTRLAGCYSPAARAALAAALCRDMFDIVTRIRGIDRVFVVTQEPCVIRLARRNGWETIVESIQVSESHSVDAASRMCAEWGVQALLRLPIDIPLAQPADVEAIFDQFAEGGSCVLIPSRDGTGTNALLRSPPMLFPSHFGPNSFALHLEAARARGTQIKILRNPRIELDIDDYDDLLTLNGRLPPSSKTEQWMHENLYSAERQSAE